MNGSSRKRNFSTVIILVIVLLVPGFLYVMLNRVGTNSYVKLPVFGEKVLSGKMNRKMGREIPDTIFHTIPAMGMLNSKGDSVQFLGVDSVISVVHLFYTKDVGLSPSLVVGLKPVVERFKGNRNVRFYSISVDATDKPEDLTNFAKQTGVDLNGHWSFVGNPKQDILQYSRKQLLLDAFRNPQDSSKFVISNQYILIDTENRIRGVYDINLKTEVDRLEDEIKVQLVEEIRNNPIEIEKK